VTVVYVVLGCGAIGALLQTTVVGGEVPADGLELSRTDMLNAGV
jgi:hypothetical protein